MEGLRGTLKSQSPCCRDWARGSTAALSACRSGPGRRCWTCSPARSWAEGCRSHNASGCICSTRSPCGPCWRSAVFWDGICPPTGTSSPWRETQHWTGPHRCPCPLWHDVWRRLLHSRWRHLIQKGKEATVSDLGRNIHHTLVNPTHFVHQRLFHLSRTGDL